MTGMGGQYHRNIHFDDWICYEEVKCTTIEDILSKHSFTSIDLLQIDTEGYDFEIIKTINFQKLKISIISFEHDHLSQQEQLECKNLLLKNGYLLEQYDGNTIAALK